jgi:hypothetical protein
VIEEPADPFCQFGEIGRGCRYPAHFPFANPNLTRIVKQSPR